MEKMEIKIQKLSEIKPYFNNPRDNDKAIPPTMESIRKYGFVKPILCDVDGVIICGHTRYVAAYRLGVDKVPVIYSDMDEDLAKQYRLVDNKIAEKSEFDEDEMIEELRGMKMPENMQAFFFGDVKDMISPDMPKFDASSSGFNYASGDMLDKQNDASHDELSRNTLSPSSESDSGFDNESDEQSATEEDEDLTDIYKVKVVNGRKKMKVVCPYCGNIEIIEVQ
ncbi:MAG: ParB N-terminal domain-containing protein [Alistipes indistinctus]